MCPSQTTIKLMNGRGMSFQTSRKVKRTPEHNVTEKQMVESEYTGCPNDKR